MMDGLLALAAPFCANVLK